MAVRLREKDALSYPFQARQPFDAVDCHLSLKAIGQDLG